MDSLDIALERLVSMLPEILRKPKVGIVCGSGLSGLAASFREVKIIPYVKLHGFAVSTVPGHKSELAFGIVGPGKGTPAVAMLGRFHFYEGHSFRDVVYPIRLMARLGVKNIIITNAAGSLNPSIPVGTIVVVHDHLALPNLSGSNPLIGPRFSPNLPPFLPLSDAYSTTLRRLVFLAANKLAFDRCALAEGTYAWVCGPTYETPAEGRFLRNAGADIVGMSTIPEVIVAREEGMNVLVLSLVTNNVVIPEEYRSIRDEVDAEIRGIPIATSDVGVVTHNEVLATGQEKAPLMRNLVEKVVELMSLQLDF